MKRNAQLLNKAADRIEKIPTSYSQDTFYATDSRSPCGTVACLAGEIVIVSERSVTAGIKKLSLDPQPYKTASRLAGLTYDEENALFAFGGGWPDPFRAQYDRAKTQRGRAGAAARLLRYLAKGGKV